MMICYFYHDNYVLFYSHGGHCRLPTKIRSPLFPKTMAGLHVPSFLADRRGTVPMAGETKFCSMEDVQGITHCAWVDKASELKQTEGR